MEELKGKDNNFVINWLIKEGADVDVIELFKSK